MKRTAMLASLRRYLIAGLLVWLPLAATILVVRGLVGFLDSTLLLLPAAYRPDALLGFHIPGLGVVLTFVVVLLTGLIAVNMFGKQLVRAWEALMDHIPLVRSIYSAVKQLAETMFSNGKSFRKVLLIEYPRKGSWTLAFQTSADVGEAQLKTGSDVINVYVPTTPNPTSGFFLMIPKAEVVELEMSVDEGLRMLISMGAIVPPYGPAQTAAPKEGA